MLRDVIKVVVVVAFWFAVLGLVGAYVPELFDTAYVEEVTR